MATCICCSPDPAGSSKKKKKQFFFFTPRGRLGVAAMFSSPAAWRARHLRLVMSAVRDITTTWRNIYFFFSSKKTAACCSPGSGRAANCGLCDGRGRPSPFIYYFYYIILLFCAVCSIPHIASSNLLLAFYY